MRFNFIHNLFRLRGIEMRNQLKFNALTLFGEEASISNIALCTQQPHFIVHKLTNQIAFSIGHSCNFNTQILSLLGWSLLWRRFRVQFKYSILWLTSTYKTAHFSVRPFILFTIHDELCTSVAYDSTLDLFRLRNVCADIGKKAHGKPFKCGISYGNRLMSRINFRLKSFYVRQRSHCITSIQLNFHSKAFRWAKLSSQIFKPIKLIRRKKHVDGCLLCFCFLHNETISIDVLKGDICAFYPWFWYEKRIIKSRPDRLRPI